MVAAAAALAAVVTASQPDSTDSTRELWGLETRRFVIVISSSHRVEVLAVAVAVAVVERV